MTDFDIISMIKLTWADIIPLPRLASDKASKYQKLVVKIQNLIDRKGDTYILCFKDRTEESILKEKEFCKRLDKIIMDYMES